MKRDDKLDYVFIKQGDVMYVPGELLWFMYFGFLHSTHVDN